jgi:CheY-like chemotaxis protein
MIRRLLEMKTSIKIIDEASDGMKAINKLLEHTSSQLVSYDVIMMDSEMPNMSGPDAVRQIRSIGYQGLIIGVTGNSLKADIDNFTKAGCNHVMIKPLDIDQFISYVQGTFICLINFIHPQYMMITFVTF